MKDEESIELATSLTSESPLTQSAIESQPKFSSCLIDRAVEGEMRVRSGEQSPVISVVRRTSTAMELQQVCGQLKELVNQQEATYVMNGPKQTKQKQQQTQIQVRSSTVEHLIKLIMFLVTLTCLHLPVQQVDSQRLFRHHNQNQPDQQLANNPFAASDRLVLGQHQAFDQLLRSGNSNLNSNYNNNFHFNSRIPNNQYHEQILTASQMLANQQRPAERRASAGPVGQVPQPGNQASPSSSPQQQKENGKLLVCYYTTRQSAPYWPKDAREYVIPADNINSITGTVDLSQATFAPILQYEPFKSGRTGGGSVSSDGFAQQQQALDFGFDPNFQMKNQQQQLVFKSASMQLPQLMGGQHLFDSLSGTRSAYLNVSSNSNNIANNNGNVGNSAKQHQDAISQMLELQQQQQQQLNPAHQQTLVIAGSATGDNPATNKNKQTPAYSFIGDLDANNGLIVGGGSGTIAPTISTLLQQPNSGANNLLINKDKSGASSQLDRNSMKQQLLFSPSLSRAFIVGNSGPNLNNEVLDTKSQLFIHPQQVAQANSNNNQYHPQTGAASMAYQHDKGKSAKVSGGEQVSGGVGAYQFSGSVSSTPPVPLSSASSVAMQSVAVPTYRSPLQHFSAANQLVISNNGQHGNSPKSPSAATPSSGSNSAALKLPYVDGSATKTASVPVSSSSSSSSAAQSALPNAGSSTATNGINSSSSQQQSASLSSALVSSPLSTMFDVFGAASQYLMRFKPSSLMSPGTLSFNTLSADHHHHQHANNQQVATKLANSSLLSSLSSGSSSGSLIPLPFASSLVSSIHKSSSTSNERAGSSSSSSSGVGSGILSRFSLQSAQRREDVCGRTIQTPERRIIGGEGAKYGEFPYQVHIKIAKHQCGGALVDKQSIVTAAHCVYHFITRAPVSKLQIVIGAYDIEDEQYQELPPQYFKVNKVKLHPNFRFSASHPDRYDIAILKLDKPVKYTDNVLPVCLPSKDLKFESAVGTVTGFGKTDPSLSNRYGTRLLQKVDVPIIENNECERWHRTRGIDLKIFPEMMCAGYEDGLKDACVGDSGGPLVVKTAAGPDGSFRWTLAGITSAGFGCAQSRQPGIYHRVSHTVDWILENLD